MYPIFTSGMIVVMSCGQVLLESFLEKWPTDFLLQEPLGLEMSKLYKDLCYWELKPTHPTGANTDAEWVHPNNFSAPSSRWIWIANHSVQDTWPIHHVKAGISKVPHSSLEHYKKTGQGSWRGYHCSGNFATEILIFVLQEVLMTQISLMGRFCHHT